MSRDMQLLASGMLDPHLSPSGLQLAFYRQAGSSPVASGVLYV